jgi:outer membrane receptor protein involved in Fe transport
MRGRLILLLSLLTFPVSAFAFEGRIVDGEGKPIANAEVYILGRPGEAITDADGRFSWKPDPAPPFEILVIVPGGTYMRPILVERLDAETELTLAVQPVVSEVITVSGSAPGIETTPAAGTATLSARELDTRRPANLMQALENVAGVNQVSEGQSAVPAVRGLARGRTLILIDGARVTSERRVGPSASFLDPAIVESMEVSRGPGSVAYGSDAFGGVISVRTKSVAPGSPLQIRASGLIGAGVPERRGSVELSKGVAAGGVLVAAHSRKADDYDSPEGSVLNSGYSDHGLLARGEHQVGRGFLTAGWQSDFGRDVERPRNNSQTVRFYYPTEDSHRFTSGYELHDVGGFQRVGLAGFLGSHAQITDQDRYATPTTPRSIERADVSSNDWQARAFTEKLVGPARLELGLDLNGRFDLHAIDSIVRYDEAGNIASQVDNVSVETARRIDSGVYASVDTALSSVITLAGGLRGDYVTTRNEGGYFGDRSTSNGAASGFAALTAGSFRGWTLTGQIARGFRDPTLSDRYYRGPTGRGFITGNPDLEPETSLQVDVAARYTAGRYRMAAYYYWYRISDLIERYQTETDFFFFRNRGRARLQGVEVEAQADFGDGTTVELAAQVARGRALDDDMYLDDVAPENVSVQLRRRLTSNAFAAVRIALFAEDEQPGPTEVRTPGFVLLDASGGVDIGRHLQLQLIARNLLNQAYYASPDPRWVLAPGRSASLSLAARF